MPLWTVLAAAALAGSDLQEPPQDLKPAASSLEISLLAGVWIPRLGGTSASPSSGGDIDLATQFQMEDSEPTLNIEVGVRKDDVWEMYFGGFGFETGHTGTFLGSGTFGGIALTPGDPFSSSFKMTSVSFELLYTAWRPYADGSKWRQKYAPNIDNHNPDGRYTVDLRFSPMFGMRWIDVDQSLASGASLVETGGEWLGIYAGMDFELNYRPPDPIPALAMLQFKGSFDLVHAMGGNVFFMLQVRAVMTV